MKKIASIVIGYSEGLTDIVDLFRNRPVKTWEQADTFLRALAWHAPKKGGYNKTDVKVTWEDGEVYEARVDLTFEDATKDEILKPHIKEFVGFYAGRNKPRHWTQERYDNYLRVYNRDHSNYGSQAFRAFLDAGYLDTP